jgi:cytochrome d ubiquinol oxidase subunit I
VTDLLAARLGMALSLAFHILFAAAGITMPLLMVISEWRWLRSRDPVDLELTKRWMKGTAILFAVGAVSGTVLSFELGLLWPRFMRWAGPVIGMPFSLEGFAFFLEAIFLGIYLYGWNRVRPLVHWLSGVVVAVSGCVSGIFVVMANSWMNTPTGFRMVNGQPVDIDPFAAMFNPGAFHQTLHMTIAAYQSIAFAALGIHAFMLLRDPANRFHRRALSLLLPLAAITSLLQPLSGDVSAKFVARWQPAKLAAMEGHWETGPRAPLLIGGVPDEQAETTRWAIPIPGGLSFLAFGDFNATVRGLKEFPRDERPPVLVTHLAFQVMVGCGMAMLLVALAGMAMWAKRRALPLDRRYLWALVACAPLGMLAMEAGWTVTEVGRQPWVVYGIMRTADAVTPMPGLVVPMVTILLVYVFLGFVVIALLRRQVFIATRETTALPPSPVGAAAAEVAPDASASVPPEREAS